jgi:putative spermidine/putrescine transport system permease protein
VAGASGTIGVGDGASYAPSRPVWATSIRPWALSAFSLLFFGAFFVGPLLTVVYFSFLKSRIGRPAGVEYTLANYVKFVGDPWYWGVFARSLKLSVIVTVVTLVLGYAIAYWLDRVVKRRQGLLIGLLLSPILVSLVVQSYGWLVLLSPRGVVNSILLGLGLVDRPVKLIFNEVGVVIGLVQFILPFVVLPVLTALQNIDRSLERAAQNLGARPLAAFRRVTLPLSMPGVVAGAILAFLLSLSALVTPILMGGQVVITLPVLAFQQFGQSFNWAFGSTIVTILTAFVLVLLIIANRVLPATRAAGQIR